MRNGTLDLGTLCSNALPVSHRYSMINKAIGKLSKLKIYHFSNSIYKHDAIDIADPSSMQDTCHIWLRNGLAHYRGSEVEHQSAESKGLRFDSSWPHGDSEFFLCPKLVKRLITSFSKLNIFAKTTACRFFRNVWWGIQTLFKETHLKISWRWKG